MTFTNRVGRDMYIKLSSEDDEKVLRASDSRVCFIYKETSDCDKLQVSGFGYRNYLCWLFVTAVLLSSLLMAIVLPRFS